ncbi:putative two-component sensor response regulator [Paenibacillus sp. J23TS9]|uniref:helix-turn-helix domain-containing protein n=1 Tax=Paenibacillus sp. J23TS9 TaxID=2807193 RepID=UPI001B210747|nr:helix-turn-helix domain-containing protein [Paenibacillus sp. J23TS9]GIP28543.1 putative two-component sensor response regulator [Paenibacillus sp. J23TS9]
MYQVMLVDDDVMVLNFLEKLVPWNELGFELAGAYTNAHDAIRKCGEMVPDLIITDIGMPVLDGLSFIKQLQAGAAKTRFVILSCHDEFHFAQQAVQLGVQDYILKESLSLERMKDILERVRGKMDDDRHLKLHVDRLNYQANRSREALKEKWLRNLLSSPVLEDTTLYEQLQEYGLDITLGHFIPVCCRIHRFQDAIVRYNSGDMVKFIVENTVEELLREEQNVIFFSYSAQEFFLLCACRKELISNPYDKMVQISNHLQKAFTKYLKIEVSMLIGEMISSGEGIKRQLPKLLSSADDFFYSSGPVIVKSFDIAPKVHQEDIFIHYSEYSERLNHLLIEENGDIESVIKSFFEFIESRRFQPSNVKQFVWKLALDLQLKLKFSIYFDTEKVQHDIAQMLNVSELRDWLLKFMNEAVIHAEQISKKSKKSEIIDAQKYVQLNLHRKITLEEVADRLHLNLSYFSRLYKKETGENFIEHVTRMKMEKAKLLLLHPDHTVEKVALMLGYDNKSYFVKLFKQHFGLSPSQYM